MSDYKFDAMRWCRTMAKAHWQRNEHGISSTFRTVAEEIDRLRARHNALREAVAWERECIDTWEYGTALKMQALDEQVASMRAARAEVDRLIANERGDK